VLSARIPSDRFYDIFNKFLYIHLMQDLLGVHPSKIDKSRIQPDPADILKLLGEQEEISEDHTLDLVDRYISESLRLSSPEGAFLITEALESTSSGTIKVPGISFESGKIIQKMLRHSEYYALFIVTAGAEAETLARSLLEAGNYLEGYIVDLVASYIVDLVADQVEDQVRQLVLMRGMQITNRYSPGYCSWKVEEQQKLFSLFPNGCCGISLSSSSLMNPIKSISGIIGIGSGVRYQDYSCELCSMTDCTFRRTRIQ
jgi:hypothetical protein